MHKNLERDVAESVYEGHHVIVKKREINEKQGLIACMQ